MLQMPQECGPEYQTSHTNYCSNFFQLAIANPELVLTLKIKLSKKSIQYKKILICPF